MKIHFKTFGCKVNQCETAKMRSKVLGVGCNLSDPENADVVVVNSCTVTANADKKTKQYLRKCLRLSPESKFFLTGCYADRSWKKLKTEFSNIKLFKNSEKEIGHASKKYQENGTNPDEQDSGRMDVQSRIIFRFQFKTKKLSASDKKKG